MAIFRLLVVRNDKLGDFMLAWPTFALIKRYWPDIHITALVPNYTAPMARLAPWIDELLIDGASDNWRTLAQKLKQSNFDAMLTLFSSGRIGVAGCLARIPYRLAPATKLVQFCYNHRLVQRRSRSQKPEYAYNLDLAWRLLADFKKVPAGTVTHDQKDDWIPQELQRPFLNIKERSGSGDSLAQKMKLSTTNKLVFIHPGSGGSANNLSIEQFSKLAEQIADKSNKEVAFVITAGPGEEHVALELVAKIGVNYPATLFQSDSGIEGFARTLQIADLFISGSTGTLHIAGAMNLNTAGFYPRHRSATPLRWQTLNSPERRLAFTPADGAAEDNLSMVDIDAAAKEIVEHLL